MQYTAAVNAGILLRTVYCDNYHTMLLLYYVLFVFYVALFGVVCEADLGLLALSEPNNLYDYVVC